MTRVNFRNTAYLLSIIWVSSIGSTNASNFGIPGPWGDKCGPVTPDFSTVTPDCTDCITLSAECPKGASAQTLSLKGCKRPLNIMIKNGELTCEKSSASNNNPQGSEQETSLRKCKKRITAPVCADNIKRCESNPDGEFCQEWGDPPRTGWLDLKSMFEAGRVAEKNLDAASKAFDETEAVIDEIEKLTGEAHAFAIKTETESHENVELADALGLIMEELSLDADKAEDLKIQKLNIHSEHIRAAAQKNTNSAKELADALTRLKQRVEDAKSYIKTQDQKLNEELKGNQD
jgi:hypothetical protein